METCDTVTELLPLAIWGGTHADLPALKRAKALLNLPYNVVPVQAVPGSPTRVLALRTTPPFMCDFWRFVYTESPGEDDAELAEALEWVLNPQMNDSRALLLIDGLRGIFGAGVTELANYDF